MANANINIPVTLQGTLSISTIPAQPVLQEKTVTLSNSEQEIVADDGYDALSKVVVPGVPSGFDLVLHGQIAQIASNFFKDVTDMRSFTAPEDYGPTVSMNAFNGCTGLVSAKFRRVGAWASDVFAGCTSLTDIWIGTNKDNDGAFNFNRALNLPSNVTAIHVPAIYLNDYKANSYLQDYVDIIVGDYDIS